MAQDNKKQVEQITDMEVDFAQWFTDVCTKAELIDYSSVKGMFIYRPYGYAIWENIQSYLDKKFKETGHTNVAMPMLIPESLLQKEKDHVEGFAPECAWVTLGGSEELEEKLCIRPTSETLFCDHWSHIVHSWRDLPLLYNQWCSVLRWEKTSRPFLRHREFLWQEGHTLHATAEEAIAETEQMLNVYADLCENLLAMPVVKGLKTDKEKFAGAERTYTIECMMHDKKALQNGTSHYFGDGFAKAFGIAFSDRENKQVTPYETSWGLSTRTIGGIIMTHGDNRGLVLPPRIAPIQVIVIPVAQHKEGVIEANTAVMDRLKAAGFRVQMDDSDQSPGWYRGDRGKNARRHPRRPRRPRETEFGGKYLPCLLSGRGQGHSGGEGRLYQDHVVRLSGVRNEDEGGGGHDLPLYPLCPGASGRYLRYLRQACPEDDILGCGLLKGPALPSPSQSSRRRAGPAAGIFSILVSKN